MSPSRIVGGYKDKNGYRYISTLLYKSAHRGFYADTKTERPNKPGKVMVGGYRKAS